MADARAGDAPLQGLRVVALEQAVAGPFCSRQLADFGADVVKIERPDGGDFARGYDDRLHGLSTYFAWLNRGKRSVVCDLKTPPGLEVVRRLVPRADVFVHNLAPGAVERLGLGYESLSAANPRLIWCGISGYGPDGPQRDRKAYDMLIQAESGVVSVTGTPDAPAKVGISMADIAAGMYAYSAIATALLHRTRTGVGERIDIAMLECLAEWMMAPIYWWHGAGVPPPRAGMRHNMIAPYGAYACADGAVIFAIQNEREWRAFCELVLEQPDLAGEARFEGNGNRVRHRDALEPTIEACFARCRRSEILERLDRARIASASVNDAAGIARHPQLAARQRWVDVESPVGRIPALVPPYNLQGAPARMRPVPALGAHTDEVLAELGLGTHGAPPAAARSEGK